MAGWRLEHTYEELPQLFYSDAAPTAVREPRLAAFNRPLAIMLGLEPDALDGPEGAAIFAGNVMPEGGRPIAQAYAGHQYGRFTTLGDGRAILLGEQITPSGDRLDIQLKGPGQTPILTAGRRPCRARADAARIHHQRGDARARHSDHPEPGGGEDGGARLSRDGARRRRADARGREPHPRRHDAVGGGP